MEDEGKDGNASGNDSNAEDVDDDIAEEVNGYGVSFKNVFVFSFRAFQLLIEG